jgi:NTP pyrophosphatase (non-canonical NTP hydrolase)
LDIQAYVKQAEATDRLEPKQPTDGNYLLLPTIGLAGEIGSLLAEVKKRVRDKDRIPKSSPKRIAEELGDVLWYAATVARRAGLDFLHDVLLQNLQRVKDNPTLYMPLLDGDEHPGQRFHEQLREQVVSSFGDYQRLVGLSATRAEADKLIPYLVRIWKNSSELFELFGQSQIEAVALGREQAAEALGDVMWYVAEFATLYDLNLDAVSEQNIQKAKSMFPPDGERLPTPWNNENAKELESFPPRFDVDFVLTTSAQAVMLICGLQVGDPLTDNAYQPDESIDGYRFHDCIHLAFVAVLGWSPVFRSLMKRKRKTDKAIDEAEDGARAQIVEEMIVKLTHSYAVSVDPVELLSGQRHVSMDLLKQIESLADGLEVAGNRVRPTGCKLWEWERAILVGYELFGKLRHHMGGRVRLDLNARTATFIELKAGEGGHFACPPA